VELPLSVGAKTVACLNPIEQEVLRATSAIERPAHSRKLSIAKGALSDSQNSRTSSALHSIMEQGGLVELVPGRRQGSDTIVTRTLGDASTGTAPKSLVRENSTEMLATMSRSMNMPIPMRPALISHPSSDVTAVAVSPLDERAYLALPDTPRVSTCDDAPSPVEPSAPTFDKGGSNPKEEVSSERKTSGSETPRPAPIIPTASQEKAMHVLVVDDDPLTRMLMKRMLTRLGCRVTVAENGEHALEHLLGKPGLEPPAVDKFAVVFLDNQMPVMSGLEAVSALREAGRSDFVVGVTGNALLSDQEEYLAAGVDKCVLWFCVVMFMLANFGSNTASLQSRY
jgi:osomolarity two-component system sensor histidine kinase SLN1